MPKHILITSLLALSEGACLLDYLNMYDGSSENDGLLLQTCCPPSGTYKSVVRSTHNTMYIVFQTDPTVTATGFRTDYILEGAPTTTLSTSIPSTTTITVTVPASFRPENKTLMYIIIACAVTGVLSIIIAILTCVIFVAKRKQKITQSYKYQRKSNVPISDRV